ncbi:ECF transporter S component [Caloranaerobacter ferrireducens]|uniref:ECF transporter S component n=1 Tax=Caloranaerobacter ferrireducens TaxID=1323370 RepID=UPI00084D9CEE|nr:ECF transporter S component [Caloranaerobacter ferrireducens]
MSRGFTLKELLIISLLATISIVSKPAVFYVSSVITATFHVPAGIIGGVYYMMWLTLVYRIIKKPFSVILFCLIQAFLAVTLNGMFILKALTFIPPGIGVEIVLRTVKFKNDCIVNILAGAVANLLGASLSYILFFGKQKEIFIVVAVMSAVSGGLSGILTTFIYEKILNSKIISDLKVSVRTK